MSDMFNLVSSPTLIPVEINSYSIAKSLTFEQVSRNFSKFSSVSVSLTFLVAFTFESF